jgi:hypothetical protein
MKKFLYYILKSYFWSVIAIVIVIFFETVIIYYCGNSVDKETPFASPFIATLICGVFYPVYNLVVIISLYKYRFTPIEVAVESIFFVKLITYIDNVIIFLVPQNQLWTHKIVFGRDVYERVWWYASDMNIIYSICVIILLCLLYIKVKEIVTKSIND